MFEEVKAVQRLGVLYATYELLALWSDEIGMLFDICVFFMLCVLDHDFETDPLFNFFSKSYEDNQKISSDFFHLHV